MELCETENILHGKEHHHLNKKELRIRKCFHKLHTE